MKEMKWTKCSDQMPVPDELPFCRYLVLFKNTFARKMGCMDTGFASYFSKNGAEPQFYRPDGTLIKRPITHWYEIQYPGLPED